MINDSHGLIHLYYGEGKGKTTAALGLALRAHGAGLRVVIVQFLKGRKTAEHISLRALEIPVLHLKEDTGFSWQMTPEQKLAVTHEHNALFAQGMSLCTRPDNQESYSRVQSLLVLDEVCAVWTENLIDTDIVAEAIRMCPSYLELVITGRNPPPALLEMADYVTEMRAVRHPMDRGVSARCGIEY